MSPEENSKNYSYENIPFSHNFNHTLVDRFLFPLSKKWIAGFNRDQALKYVKQTNQRGIGCILNYLGEDLTEKGKIIDTIHEYENLLGQINIMCLKGCISIKPSQIGLSLNYDFCLNNLERIVKYAKKKGIFVWLDMESYKYVPSTILLYEELTKEHSNVGIVVQSYLKRSIPDLSDLLNYSSGIRIVKGAYKESEDVAFQSKSQIDENFINLVKLMFSQSKESQKNDCIIAIATHDSKLIDMIIDLFFQLNGNNINMEFQFLKGVRDKLKIELLKRGFRIYEYTPYGDNWLPYSIRRLKERKRNVFLLMRSLVD
ncbi:MAG: proline dehydrogenase family protein [Nitrososphaeraceae archaeon]|nr:proline dehydrogenase family protein [Nitrososphaeraceae archaeon]